MIIKDSFSLDFCFLQKNGDEDDSDEDDSDGAMEIDAPKCQSSLSQNRSVAEETTSMKDDSPVVDDGWTVVSSKRGKGRKN